MKTVRFVMNKLCFLFAVALVVSGCSLGSDLKTSASSNEGKKLYTVSGKISFEEGSRTASTSFDFEKITAENYNALTVEARQLDDEGNLTSETVQGATKLSESGWEYSVNVTSYGNWKLIFMLQVTTDEKDPETDASSFVTALYKDVDVIISEETTNLKLDVALAPFFINGVSATSGAVELKIKDSSSEGTGEDAHTRLSKVTFGKWRNLEVSMPEEDGYFYDPGVYSFDFEDGIATISLRSVPASRYQVELSFEDINGNVLYTCNEVINVFSGFTTDIWVGNGAHIKTSDSGACDFVIDNDLIQAYGAELVASTKTVVYYNDYQAYDGSGGYNYFLTDAPSSLKPVAYEGSADPDFTLNGSGDHYFCFDNDGYFYYFENNYTENTHFICTDNPKVSGGKIGVPEGITSVLTMITYDSAKNIIYGIFVNQQSAELYQFPSLASGGSVEDWKKVYFGRYNFGSQYADSFCEKFAVHDDLVYYTITGNYGDKQVSPCLVVSKISYCSILCPVAEKGVVLFGDGTMRQDDTNFGSITDILYQDGNVYMLYKASNIDQDKTVSRGALIRYNCNSGNVNTYGWADGREFSETGISKIKVNGLKGGDLILQKNEDNTYTPVFFEFTYKPGTSEYSFNAPYDSLSEHFAGPQKFVAIKPKKLVIADSGIAFYTDEFTGNLRYKNVNRVVEFDLESLSMSSQDVIVEFASSTSPGYFSSDVYLEDQIISQYLYYSSGSYYTFSTSGHTVYPSLRK